QMARLPVIGGLTWGDIALADTLPPGNYRVVAYTNWMRNAGPDYFFSRDIRILKPGPVLPVASQSARKDSIKRAGEQADILFFPESGSLVDGVRSKVAFKAIASNGLGIDVDGIVTDDVGQQVAVFKSEHLGMGIFYLTPEQGKSYKASVTFADGSQCVVNLPAAVGRGFVMNINNADSSTIRVTVTASRGILNDPQQFGKVNLVAQAGGKVYYAARSKVTSEPLVALVPKSKFPAGIVQFTLFSADGEPLNERIAFIEPHDQVRLALTPDKTGAYASRQKIRISLGAADSSRKPLTASLSASVVNESALHDDADTGPTIFSYLLLTSDLKGYIEKPGYYFTNTNEARSDLDILMLTQGYRRFEWKKILAGDETPAGYAPEKTLTVSGYVKTPGGKPVAKAKVSLLSSQGGFMMLDTVTDQNGRFVFDK
ncbi:MAG: carboxypeptidase regulatory-like domain-containing protein, partial [Bacteroidetes bacterium]|nr:carboxypeptidase regulatory-like domain-containing protein [Bacteroidota bacterium]